MIILARNRIKSINGTWYRMLYDTSDKMYLIQAFWKWTDIFWEQWNGWVIVTYMPCRKLAQQTFTALVNLGKITLHGLVTKQVKFY